MSSNGEGQSGLSHHNDVLSDTLNSVGILYENISMTGDDPQPGYDLTDMSYQETPVDKDSQMIGKQWLILVEIKCYKYIYIYPMKYT